MVPGWKYTGGGISTLLDSYAPQEEGNELWGPTVKLFGNISQANDADERISARLTSASDYDLGETASRLPVATHKDPRANTAATQNFSLLLICNCRMHR